MDYFIDNIESLSDLEYLIISENQIPQSRFEGLKFDFFKEVTAIFENSNNAEIKKILIIDVIRKVFNAKKFVNSKVEDLYVRRMLLDSYNSLFEIIEFKYKAYYPDLFKIEESWSFYNIGKKFPENGYLLGKSMETKTTIITTDNESDNLTQEIEKSEPEFDSDVFKSIDTYKSFIEYCKHIIDPYKDFSYLFQRMLHEKLIHKKTHFEYFDWLKNNKFINDKDYDKFYVKSCFVSFNKSTSANRENNFNVIFSL